MKHKQYIPKSITNTIHIAPRERTQNEVAKMLASGLTINEVARAMGRDVTDVECVLADSFREQENRSGEELREASALNRDIEQAERLGHTKTGMDTVL